jgi:two-component system CheB/CheR fusion protein
MPLTTVGIGASAGGLEAIGELLAALPPTTGMAYIVVQHLDPKHESLLAEILAKKTPIPVTVAHSGEIVQADHVYVIPPDVTLTVVAGRIVLSPRPSAPERSFPIDALFKSLADASGDHAIAVVLSGGDSDGSSGAQAVRRAGGLTLAQSPDTARFSDMPRHAIGTGCIDLVLRPNEIAHELVRLGQRLGSGAEASRPTSGTDQGADADEASLRHIFHRLRAVHGVNFTHYKRTTMSRRLERRMALRRIDGLDEYCRLIDDDPGELAALYQDFLIRVTEFFRDPESFDALRRYVFPVVCEGLSGKRLLRIWVPGCASGEEVYSVAMALLEYFGDSVPSARIQIFGTDVSETALEHARAGVYTATAVHQVSSERLQRFFTKQNGEYRIAKNVRDLCLFARQDVTHDPPFSRLDLISCRNLLIYLDGVAQQRVLRTFHYALRHEGMLIFGPAETVGPSSDLFEQVDKRFRVYRRLPAHHGGSGMPPVHASDASTPASGKKDTALDVDAESLLREADRLLLARFAPASLVINHAFTILQYRGHIGPYLEPAGGAPSFDLRRVVRPELLVSITPAMQEASSTAAPSHREVRMDDGRGVSLEIIPLKGSPDARVFLILFDDGARQRPSAEVSAAAAALPESEKDRRLGELERDIAGLRAYLRAAIEEHGAIEEELKSAHEEVLSANEEFQSTNEELETSKEELQSTNEELTTTIDELRHRNQELAAVNAELDDTRKATERARSYADIIDTVRQPLAVMDSAQRILRVNAAFSLDLGVPREKAEGQLLHDIDDGRWNIPELRQRLRDVVSGGQTMEDYEVTLELTGQGRRVLSLNARKLPGDPERAELLLLAINDVTVRAGITAGLVATNERKDGFLALLGHELRHPLTPITHAVYLLRRTNPEPAVAELLDTIDTQTHTLLRFVNDLLDVARIGRGLIEVRRDPVDLASVVHEATRVVEPLIESRQHMLSVNQTADSVSIKGDAERLKQVITNLLENAAKFTEPGGQITVTLEQRDGSALLRVHDTGMGIARENLERIFEPFTQSSDSLGNSGGLGLGLSVARRVVELHRGHIEARSDGLTRGSEFVVWLPLLVLDEAGDQQHAGQMRTLPAPITLHQRKVLIVDDHDEVRMSLARIVRSFGHEVALAKDGPSALVLAERFQPDCAMLDISMPGMSGMELGRRLRAVFPRERLYMIALTGFTGEDIREGCLAAGFDEHLNKPGDIHKLAQLLGGDRGETAVASR